MNHSADDDHGRLSERLADLETLVTYLQRELHGVNQVVYAQSQEIVELRRLVQTFIDHWKYAQQDGNEVPPVGEEPPPPHY